MTDTPAPLIGPEAAPDVSRETPEPEPPRSRGAIRPDARVLAVGSTGTGKSTLLRWLFATQFGERSGHARRVLIDPQDAYELVPERGTHEGHGAETIRADVPLLRVVPRQDPKDWAEIYRRLNQLPNTVVWLDEAALAPRPGTREAAPLREYQTTGRKYRRAHLVASQFPVAIDRTFVDQAEHLLVFQLRRPEDLQRLAGMLGLDSWRGLRTSLAGFPRPDGGGPSHSFLWGDMTRHTATVRDPLPAPAMHAADRIVRAMK